ncbi:MAG: hypothetical protein K0A95_07485 [Chromatiales bacterium]|nr:hypothetical protein [Gammaproteobacteria bacterium]MBW6476899.1 hypothetical protein [Chromatiales bacterium]
MITSCRLLTSLSLLGLALLLPLTASAQIKCWTNKDGIRECGNVVPPEYAQQETRTMDRRGITTEVRPRARTDEEIEVERQRQAEEERRQAETDRLKKEQQDRDRVLMATYLSEEDIIRTRDRMAGTINAAIELSRINLEKMQERLAEERRRAANFERQGREVPKRNQEEIQGLEELIAERQQYIANREAERERLIARYEEERQRFRELQQRIRNH